MSGARRSSLALAPRAGFDELLAACAEAPGRRRRRALARLSDDAALVEAAVAELAEWPAARCAAVDEACGVVSGRCGAGGACAVEEVCPLAAEGTLGGGAAARLIGAAAARLRIEAPAAPCARLEELRSLVERLLARDGRAAARRGEALAALDLALARGGLFGATGPFLRGAEMERVAAFTPPGCGRGDALLAPVEAWIRRAAIMDAALVELR
ncbi:hypothetical protein LLG88_10275 [bacterium]|nr:hypothetical protein [bacterium]